MAIWTVEIGESFMDGVKKKIKINNKGDKGAFIECEIKVGLEQCEEECLRQSESTMT